MVCGIMPSPQALSSTPARRSTTATSSPARAAVQRGGQTRGPAAGDEQVDHVRLASAEFSTLTRVRSSAALSTVKTRAVSHAECTKGNAMPSMTTAT